MFSDKLKQYARLVIKTGLNVQPGQPVMIRCPVDCAYFGRLCEREAYEAGASFVEMNWGDDESTRMRYLMAADSDFDTVHPWVSLKSNTMAEMGAAFLSISASDPMLLDGVDPDRIRRASNAAGAALQPYRNAAMQNEVQWCVVSIPIPSWAKTVFPDETEEKAMEKLWDAIFMTCRISDDGDAVKAWEDHISSMTARREHLDSLHMKRLHYYASNGTDLIIELPEGHFWGAAQEVNTRTGTKFTPNMPTEEIFSAPKRDGVNGVAVATKPLVLDGHIVKDFKFTFKDGRIVDVEAAEGLEALKNAITLDDGASYLGEVALVPYDSPISNTGILFYNTLFDENAACHLAFGASYPMVEGAEHMTEEERLKLGLNTSMTHEDFMVGCSDLSIDGTLADGTVIPVFRSGNFVF